MGTLLYSYGIDRCFEELNISKPEEIRRVHEAYVQAGADIIQTNTYGANFIKLSRYGLEDETKQINEKPSASPAPPPAPLMFSVRSAESGRSTKTRILSRTLKEASANSSTFC